MPANKLKTNTLAFLTATALVGCGQLNVDEYIDRASPSNADEANESFDWEDDGDDAPQADAFVLNNDGNGLDDENESEANNAIDIAAELDFNCIKIDQVKDPLMVPPAGIRVNFRVTDCNGDPVPQIGPENLRVVNDEKGEVFGAGFEGGGVSDLGTPDNYGLVSVIALDMSESIFQRGAVDQVIDGALTYLDKIAVAPSEETVHEVSLVAFGRPDAFEVVQPFTSDHSAVRAKLEELRTSESRGSTDLYGAYVEGLIMAGAQSLNYDLSERFFVLLTDGTHEAGQDELMRNNALTYKTESSTHIYVIGIDGNYDEERLAELTTTEENFVKANVDGKAGEQSLEKAFQRVAARVDAMARSNYVVGVCSPIALGDPSLTIEVSMQGTDGSSPVDSVTLEYSVENLDGNTASCTPQGIATSKLTCDSNGDCNVACQEMTCGCDRGVICGECGDAMTCSENFACETGDGPGPGYKSCEDQDFGLVAARGITVGNIEANQAVGIALNSGSSEILPSNRNARIVKNRDVLVRAGWSLPSDWEAREIMARIHLVSADGETLAMDESRYIEAVSSWSSLDRSFNFDIPAQWSVPDVRYSVSFFEIDEERINTAAPEQPARFPNTGSAELGVTDDDMALHVTIVPVRHQVSGCVKTPSADAIAKAYTKALSVQYPSNNVIVDVRSSAYTFTSALNRTTWGHLLSQVTQLRSGDGASPDTFYYGLVEPCGSTGGIGGLGYVPGNASSPTVQTQRTAVGLKYENIFLHELGHNHGRKHIACNGGEAGVDYTYPHPQGDTGVWGYDRFKTEIYAPTRKDFMTYCGNTWVSDFGWEQAYDTISGINKWANADVSGDTRGVLMGVFAPDGSVTWWTAQGSVTPTDTNMDSAATFMSNGVIVEATSAHYSLLSDDESVLFVADLPEDIDDVTHFQLGAVEGLAELSGEAFGVGYEWNSVQLHE